MMRNRLTIAVVALLLVPGQAFAQEVDCYENPEDPACVDDEVEDRVDEREEVTEEDVEEASVEAVTTSAESDDAALAETGVGANLFTMVAALMLAAGVLLLVVSRRRGSAV